MCFLLTVLPGFSKRSEISSETFFIFEMSSVMLVPGRTGMGVASASCDDTLITFLTASCLPLTCQNAVLGGLLAISQREAHCLQHPIGLFLILFVELEADS